MEAAWPFLAGGFFFHFNQNGYIFDPETEIWVRRLEPARERIGPGTRLE
jgi:hypothetical protein